MTPELPNDPRQEIEAKLTALLLGELPADEAFALGRSIEQDPELKKAFERLKQTIKLVKETEAPVPGQEPAPLKLSDKRREALLQQFKTVKPKEFERPRWRKIGISEIATVVAVIGFVAILAAMLLPALSSSKARAQRYAAATRDRGESESLSLLNPKSVQSKTREGEIDGRLRLPAASAGAETRRADAGSPAFGDIVITNGMWTATVNGASDADTGSAANWPAPTTVFDNLSTTRGGHGVAAKDGSDFSTAVPSRPQVPSIQIVLPPSNEVALNTSTPQGWSNTEASKQGSAQLFSRKSPDTQLYNSGDIAGGTMNLDDVGGLKSAPRTPVPGQTNPTVAANSFDFYLDLDRNGKFDSNGRSPVPAQAANSGLNSNGRVSGQVGQGVYLGNQLAAAPRSGGQGGGGGGGAGGPTTLGTSAQPVDSTVALSAGTPGIATVDPATGLPLPMVTPQEPAAAATAPLVTQTYQLDPNAVLQRLDEWGVANSNGNRANAFAGGGSGGSARYAAGATSAITLSVNGISESQDKIRAFTNSGSMGAYKLRTDDFDADGLRHNGTFSPAPGAATPSTPATVSGSSLVGGANIVTNVSDFGIALNGGVPGDTVNKEIPAKQPQILTPPAASAEPPITATVTDAEVVQRAPVGIEEKRVSRVPTASPKAEANSTVQDAKMLFEAGDYVEAENKAKLALARDPNDRAARYYWDVIQDARSKEHGANQAPVSGPGVTAMEKERFGGRQEKASPSPKPTELAKSSSPDLAGGPAFKKDTVYSERFRSAADLPQGATVLKDGKSGEKAQTESAKSISGAGSNVNTLNIVGYANVQLSTNQANANWYALQQQEQKLEEMKRFDQVLQMKLATETTENLVPKTTPIQIIDAAQPATNASQSIWAKITGKPPQYESTARLRLDKDVTDLVDSDLPSGAYDPYFIQTESETVQSTQVLGRVVQQLHLDEKWAKNGGRISTNEAIGKLKGMLDVKPQKDSAFLNIEVKDRNAQEAADIANSVAKSYTDYRHEVRRQLSAGDVAALKEGISEQQKKMADKKKVAGEVGQKLKVPGSTSPAQVAANSVPTRAIRTNAPASAVAEDGPLPKATTPLPIPQPEVPAAENPFSTFSLNVSHVSFKLAAASLEKGQLPDPAGIRSEEFINAMDYRDPEPPANVPVAFAWERAQYPFAQGRDVLRFSIKTGAQGREAGKPLNLVLLVDNSGSMERADRVQILRESMRVLATQLKAQDRLSIVTFARTPHLRVDAVSGDKAAQAVDEVTGLTPEGGTNLGEGMNLAYQTVLRHYLTNGVNRVVVLTDGAANLGDVVPESLKAKVEGYRKQGVALDCFGIGWEGFNDDLLEMLSRNGDGRYGFINSPEEAASEFAGQLAGALHVAASDVKVQVEFNPKRVTAYRQIGYAKHQLTKEQFRDNTVDAAEIGAAEAGNALYVIQVNGSGEGPIATVRVRFRVPNTADYREHEWQVPYFGAAVLLEQASPTMRLAATASAFSEWLATSPYAGEVTPDALLRYLAGVPQVYGADGRPAKLETMIREAKSASGK